MNFIDNFDENLVNQAIENGTKYLLSKTTNACWRGFPTLAGESDIWVTGFIVAHICDLCDEEKGIMEAQNFLINSCQPSKGWSYSPIVPSDADSTAWCLMALESCEKFRGLELENAKTFLWSHFVDNGISTYKVDSGIGQFISATTNDMIQGWTSAHPDVTIAAVLADIKNEKVSSILTWLAKQQTEEGFINSYWWRSPYYTTTLLLRALSLIHETLPYDHSTKILQSLVQRQLPDGGFGIDASTYLDPFTTALALECLVHLSDMDHNQEKKSCTSSLLQSQNRDGSWNGDYILRIPAPHILDPNKVDSWDSVRGGGNSFVKDQDGLFATAMACFALDCYKRSEFYKNKGNSSKTSKN